MYTTKTSKSKTLRKANGNYKPYPINNGHKHSKARRAKLLAYENNPENIQEIKDKRILKQTTFDTKKAARIAANWVPKDNSHYLKYLIRKETAITLHSSNSTAIKAEAKHRAEQSKQDIAKLKAEQAKWKAEYIPTGNKTDNPTFNGIGNRRPDRGSIVTMIKDGTYYNNGKKLNKRSIYGVNRRYNNSLVNSPFKIRREILMLNKVA